MFNAPFVAAVTAFSGTMDPDKNGKMPIMLQCLAGKMPNRNVLAGTLAERIGIEIGKTYLMQVREQGTDKQFGQDFTFIRIRELTSGRDTIETMKELGPPIVVIVQRPEGYENTYERKTRAVEGLRAKRIKEGNYIPSYPTSIVDHETSPQIIEGTSQDVITRKDEIKEAERKEAKS